MSTCAARPRLFGDPSTSWWRPRSGARLVHACGFDSIPSDLGTLLLAHHCAAADRPLEQAMTTVRRLRGGLSGGTLASMFGLIEDAVNDKSVRRVLGHPYSLNPADQRHGADSSDRNDAATMKTMNAGQRPLSWRGSARIVGRSAALLGYAAPGFRYENMACKSNGKQTMALGTKLLTVGAALAPPAG